MIMKLWALWALAGTVSALLPVIVPPNDDANGTQWGPVTADISANRCRAFAVDFEGGKRCINQAWRGRREAWRGRREAWRGRREGRRRRGGRKNWRDRGRSGAHGARARVLEVGAAPAALVLVADFKHLEL